METSEIRRRWLSYFEGRGHTVVPSAPLLYDDPNLLFVNAGMVPFKPYLLGQETPPFRRATSVQKCVRTGDIEEVGKTSRHGTFFQMCGNFSFGDYFKEGAIKNAWELITSSVADGGFGLNPDLLWVTVLEGDDESAELWQQLTSMPAERIVTRGAADNYWSMGVPGPGGPCSEIYYDRGPSYGPDGGPAVDEDRFMEFWNLVFMQDELSAVRSKVDFDIAGPLPSKNIDTGLGLERLASILQGVDNMYEIDEVRPVLDKAAEMSGRRYGADPANPHHHADDVRMRVVADHVRSSLMLIGDGVTPGNEGRGYVLRRMLRRAVRSMRLLGVDDPALPALLPVSLGCMSKSYPELQRDWDRISSIAYAEEEAFRKTLNAGTTILETAVRSTKAQGGSVLAGSDAFALHDTYGFPIDLTLEMASEHGLQVDEEGFRSLMHQQRQRAKDDAKAKKSGHGDTHAYREIADAMGREVTFTGYVEATSDATVQGIISRGDVVREAQEGQEIELVLDRTPFYPEGGGQIADTGIIELDNGARVEVLDVQKPITGLITHRCRVLHGEIAVGRSALGAIDAERRASIARAHTATHMVHKAIREVLGETATQAGSENSPGRLRFDFNSSKGLQGEGMVDVESRVNAMLIRDLEVSSQIMSQDEALSAGALALFGEKYGTEVRVISVGDWSHELCGGTHVGSSAQLGVVKLLSESSIGSGVRRVEALVGTDAYTYLAREEAIVRQLTEILKVKSEDIPERINTLLTKLKDAEKEVAAIRRRQLKEVVPSLVQGAESLAGCRFVSHHLPGQVDVDDVRGVVTDVRQQLGESEPSVVMISCTSNDRPLVVIATNGSARERGLHAGNLVKVAAGALGGGGGGKPDLAQGGGTNVDALPAAQRAVRDAVSGAMVG